MLVHFHYHRGITVPYVNSVLACTAERAAAQVTDLVNGSPRLQLLEAYIRMHRPGKSTLQLREYLHLPILEHATALTRLLASDHPLQIEQLRRALPPIPRCERQCRFCGADGSIEDECHVLLDCNGSLPLLRLRSPMLVSLFQTCPGLRRLRVSLSSIDFLACILLEPRVAPSLTRYIHAVFELCRSMT